MDTSSNSPRQNKSAWYDKIWLVIMLCFLFFPIGLYALWKSSIISTTWKFGVTIVFAIFIVAILLDSEKKGKTDLESNQPDTTIKLIKATPAAPINDKGTELNNQLKVEIAGFDKPFDANTYRNSIENLQLEIVLFNLWANIVNEGKNSADKENQKLAVELLNKASTRQVKEFPKIREAYKEIAAKKLWENDIYISTEGATNSIINLTGGFFATNKNIAETQKTISEILTQFRFKEVRYRWYKGSDEFTYYKLETPKDSEVITVTK